VCIGLYKVKKLSLVLDKAGREEWVIKPAFLNTALHEMSG
jgi:hypothetical protein